MTNGFNVGDVISAVVLEIKDETAIVKFKDKATPIEARFTADLDVGDKITVEVRGWYNGELLLKVIKENKNNIDYQA